MATNPYAAADQRERERIIAKRASGAPTLVRHPYSGRPMTGEELGEFLEDMRNAAVLDTNDLGPRTCTNSVDHV